MEFKGKKIVIKTGQEKHSVLQNISIIKVLLDSADANGYRKQVNLYR